jgi:hypothetical protein
MKVRLFRGIRRLCIVFAVAAVGNGLTMPADARAERVNYALKDAEFSVQEDIEEYLPGVHDRLAQNYVEFDPIDEGRKVGFIEHGGKAGGVGRIRVLGTMSGTVYDRISEYDCHEGPCQYRTVCEVTEDYLGVPEVVRVELSRPPGKHKPFTSKWWIPHDFATQQCSDGIGLLTFKEPFGSQASGPTDLKGKTKTLVSRGQRTDVAPAAERPDYGTRTLNWKARLVLRRIP